MSSLVTGRFFYPDDWRDGPYPQDANVAHSRLQLRKSLESLHGGSAADTDEVTRWIDRLIEAHVERYSGMNRIPVNL